MEYIEPYAKEKNILQLPVFLFSKIRPVPKVNTVVWRDGDIECELLAQCEHGLPGAFEQDVYTACMRIWIEQDMQEDIEISYSEIARKLNLSPPKAWVGKIKKSLQKLALVKYELTNSFIQAEDGERTNAYFSLLESVTLFSYDKESKRCKSKKKGRSILNFPKEVRKNLESKYYQLLDMAWFKVLPSGLPRRLYEFLAKKRYHCQDKIFRISEESLCRWLPVNDVHSTQRKKTLDAMAQALIDVGYLTSYSFDSDRKICTFTYSEKLPPVAIPFTSTATEPAPTTQLPNGGNVEPNKIDSTDDFEDMSLFQAKARQTENHDQSIVEAVLWLNSIPYMRKDTVQALASMPGFLEKYPTIRAEFDRQKEKIQSPCAWIQAAFKNGYNHIKTRKEEQIEEKIEIDNLEATAREKAANGKKYHGKRFDVFGPGLLVDEKIILWRHVDCSLFS